MSPHPDEGEEEEEKDEKKPEGGPKETLLTDKLLKARTVFLMGEINQELAKQITAQLVILDNESSEPIKLFINSQGGHVESGDTIYDVIKFLKSPVYAIGTGWVASAAITVFLGARSDHRYSLPNTRYLIHQPSGGVFGSAADIRIEAEEILKMRQRINELIARETGQDLQRIEADTERNFWMSAEEARKYGIVGKIVTNRREIE